ncbi:hypothetical protein [Jiangella muralis]|uniref:hypothetical protein n=1 Tax=Jiangella muralis TaxID=702383 RepID=UPI00069D78AE|nr:hypothetical protein [Jiangella muralis]
MSARRIYWYAVVVTPRELPEQPQAFGPYRSFDAADAAADLMRDVTAATYFDDSEYDLAVVAMVKPS